MGYVPIPCVPPPPPSPEERFRREITPKPSRGGEVLNLLIVALFLALALIPVVWWAI